MNISFLNPLYYIVMLPAMAFAMIAQWAVKYNFSKYSKYRCHGGMSGRDVAQLILDKNGIADVMIEQTSGILSDHYAPTAKKLRLSSSVYNSPSIAAVGVAAHEVGHAIQHHTGSIMMKIRQTLAIPASFASNAAIWLILAGMFLNLFLAKIGVVLFMVVVAFQLVTLPVELDASRRAKKLLKEYGITTHQDDIQGVNTVLTSAALTYLAALASSISTLLYYAIRLGLIGGKRRN